MAEIEIKTFDYSKGGYEQWILPYEYHSLYILENGKAAYIGETKDVRRRSEEHTRPKDVCSQYDKSVKLRDYFRRYIPSV